MRLKPPRSWRADGINAEVINLRTLRPMDTETVLASVRKTNRCVTVEEGWPQGSVGNYISSVIMQQAFDYLDAPVVNLHRQGCANAICRQPRKARADHR